MLPLDDIVAHVRYAFGFSTESGEYDVCMLLRNTFTSDSRVEKEAESLGRAGLRVLVLADWARHLPRMERRTGYDVRRIPRSLLTGPLWGPEVKITGSAQRRSASAERVTQGSTVADARERTRSFRDKVKEWIKNTPFVFAPVVLASRMAGKMLHATRVAASVTGAQPLVVHCHDLNTLPAGAILARATGSRLIYDAHELWAERNSSLTGMRLALDKTLSTIAERLFIRRADAVITVSQGVADELMKRYGIGMPTLLHNAPSMEFGKGGSLRELVPGEGPIALYLGGVTFGRGLEKAVESLAYLDGVRLVTMGPANEEVLDNLRRLAHGMGLSERYLHFPGVPRDEIIAWATTADVGIITTLPVCYNNVLSLPNKLFEYAFAGIPVVASNLPQIERWVTDHALGVTVDPSDPGDISRGIQNVLSGDFRFRTQEQFEEFLERNCWERQAEKLTSVYDSVVPATMRT